MAKRKKASAIVRQAVRSMSIDAARAKANDPIEVAATKPARKPVVGSHSLRPHQQTKNTQIVAASADGHRAPVSLKPNTLYPSAASQYSNGGFSNHGSP